MKKKYRNTFFDNEMVKTFLIQTFYSPMTSLASNNVLNPRPIFLFTIYTSQTASCLASGFEQRCLCIPPCFNVIFYYYYYFYYFFY